MRTWVNALGNTNNSVSNALIEKGLLLEEMGDIDPSDISVMFQAAQNSGVTINNPNVAVGTVHMPQITNPRVNVPVMLQLKLNLSVYAAQYYNAISRPLDSQIINCTRIKTLCDLNQAILNWEDPSDLPEIGQNMSIVKLLEHVREHLRGKLGIRNIPLSYVVRDNATVPPIVDDPIVPSTTYSTLHGGFHSELIERAYHGHPNYVEDNDSVLEVIV